MGRGADYYIVHKFYVRTERYQQIKFIAYDVNQVRSSLMFLISMYLTDKYLKFINKKNRKQKKHHHIY